MKPCQTFRLVSYPGTYRELCEPGYEATIIDLWMTSTAGGHADVCCHYSPDLLPNHRSEWRQTECSNLVCWQVIICEYRHCRLWDCASSLLNDSSKQTDDFPQNFCPAKSTVIHCSETAWSNGFLCFNAKLCPTVQVWGLLLHGYQPSLPEFNSPRYLHPAEASLHVCTWMCTYSGLYIEQIMFMCSLQDTRVWMILIKPVLPNLGFDPKSSPQICYTMRNFV